MNDLTGHELEPLLRGHLEIERTERGLHPHRLPAWARQQCPDPQLLMVESQLAGVRLCFRTAATSIALDVVATKREYVGLFRRPDGIYELVVDDQLVAGGGVTDGDLVSIDMRTGRHETRPGPVATVSFSGLPARPKDVTIWLPHDETTELVALRADAPIAPSPAADRTWVHHGSSISQGSNAGRPTATWPVVAARRAGVDLVNLGMGGSALLDPFMARTIRDLNASVISADIGINIVNMDVMRRRAFGPAVHGFLDTIRDGHPDTPLVLISPLLCPIHEDTPGPGAFDPEAFARGEVRFVATGDPAQVAAGRLTLSVVREELAGLVEQRKDPNLDLIDERDLYGQIDHAEHPLPDDLHPDEEAHQLIGSRFADRVALAGRPRHRYRGGPAHDGRERGAGRAPVRAR